MRYEHINTRTKIYDQDASEADTEFGGTYLHLPGGDFKRVGMKDEMKEGFVGYSV